MRKKHTYNLQNKQPLFFKKLNYGDGFVLDITTDFSKYPYEKLKEYNVIIMLNTSPNTKPNAMLLSNTWKTEAVG